MKERPILFSGPMVRAILEGRKTQTRRVVKPGAGQGWLSHGTIQKVRRFAPSKDGWWTMAVGEYREIEHCGHKMDGGHIGSVRCPYGQPGDRLLVASEIPGIPDTYCAGSDGVIYSRARDRSKWVPLKPGKHSKGYQTVSVLVDGDFKTRAVHTLICQAFYGHAEKSNLQVRHLDGNRQNSRPDNLAWGTQEQNWVDRKAHGNGCEGEKHHAAKLSNEERAHVRWAVERGLTSQRNAARALGMSQSAIQQIVQGSELSPVEPEIPADRIPPITLEVTGVRVERLQEISPQDSCAEMDALSVLSDPKHPLYEAAYGERGYAGSIDAFRALWDSLAKPGAGWNANPWVWVVEFRRVQA